MNLNPMKTQIAAALLLSIALSSRANTLIIESLAGNDNFVSDTVKVSWSGTDNFEASGTGTFGNGNQATVKFDIADPLAFSGRHEGIIFFLLGPQWATGLSIGIQEFVVVISSTQFPTSSNGEIFIPGQNFTLSGNSSTDLLFEPDATFLDSNGAEWAFHRAVSYDIDMDADGLGGEGSFTITISRSFVPDRAGTLGLLCYGMIALAGMKLRGKADKPAGQTYP
jgi:hypothetical protein